MSPPQRSSRRFGVVIPAKPASAAKSRLAPLGEEVRRELADAMLADTVAAVLDSATVGPVLVVTDDAYAARGLAGLGVVAIPDGRPGDLNETLRLGAVELARRWPKVRPVALCGDLPCLIGQVLDGVLSAAPETGAAFVPDSAGTGSTLYVAATTACFAPRFGPGSRSAHLDAGAVELEAPARLRRDVDTPEELWAAVGIGVGPRTSAAVTPLLQG